MKNPSFLRIFDLMGLVAALGIIACETSPIGAPIITNATSSNITGTTATLGGEVLAGIGDAPFDRGVIYSVTALNPNPTASGPDVKLVHEGGAGLGVFTVNVTGLLPKTRYSFVAYATNQSGGRRQTNTATFTTKADAGETDSSFTPDFGTFSFVQATATQANGQVIVGGFFNSVGGIAHGGLARLNVDGTVDPTFAADVGNAGGIYCVAVQADGQILVGGDFTSINGTPRNNIARLNPDGSPESTATFNPGTGTDGKVYSLAVQADGQILVGGAFQHVNGTALNRIARLNANGSVESAATFDPGAGADADVNSVVVQEDGQILLGGSFQNVDNTAVAFLARLNTNGSLEGAGTFDASVGANGTVFCAAVQGDGQILIAGSMTNRIARLNPDGSVESAATFDPGTGADSAITSLALQTDRKILLAGFFTGVDGVALNHIARLNADGSVDTTFDAGTGADGNVFSVAVQADGKILLGGDFQNVNGTASKLIARLKNGVATQKLTATDATRVEWTRGGAGPEVSLVTFEVSTGGAFTPLGPGTRIAGGWELTGLSLPGNGMLRARGRAAGGFQNGTSGIVRQVASFSVGTPSVSSPTSANITTTSADLGGNVTSDNGNAITERGVVYSVLDPEDPAQPAPGDDISSIEIPDSGGGTTGVFTVNVDGLDLRTTYLFQAYAGNSEGRTYSSVGTFSTLDTPTVTDPTSDNITDTSATLGGNVTDDGGQPIIERGVLYYPFVDSPDTDRLISESGVTKVVASGTTGVFTVNVAGLTHDTDYSFVAYATSTVGTSYSDITEFTTASSFVGPGGGRTSLGAALDAGFDSDLTGSFVQAMAVQPDGKTIVGGFFATVDVASREHLVRLNADGSVDTSFTTSTDGGVFSVVVQADGRILIGGAFTVVNGVTRNGFARLNSDGSLESTATFHPGSGAAGIVYHVSLQPDGKILLGGLFAAINGTVRKNLARLNADGSLENTATFNPGTGADDSVYSVVVQPDGQILLGGAFQNVSGMARNHIARMNPNGSLESTVTFNPGTGPDNRVTSLALQADAKILLGGDFTMVNGMTRNHIARLDTNGGVEDTATFNPGTGADGNVLSLAVQTDGKILLGGTFQNVNGMPRTRIARLNSNGTLESTATFNTGTGASKEVDSVAVQADGKILLGGGFATLDGAALNLIARLNNDAATQSLTVPDSTRVQWLRGGAGPEVLRVTFELSANGVNWTPLGTGTRIAGGWELTGQSLPAAGYIRARGRTAGGYLNASAGLVEQVAVFPPNDPPVAPNGMARATSGDQKTIGLPFPSPDTDGDTVTLTNVVAGAHLTINSFSGRQVTFTPEIGFKGDATFTYTVDDGSGAPNATATGTITVKVTAVPVTGGLIVNGSGAVFGSFGTPQVAAFAGVALAGPAKVATIFTADGSSVLPAVGPIAKVGAPSGDAVLVTLRNFGPVTAKNNVQLMTGLSTGTPVVAAQTGTMGGGLPAGVTIKKFLALDGNGTTTFFLATLDGTVNKLALCAVTGAGTVKIVASEGQSVTIGAATRAVATLSTLVGSKGTLAANRWRVDDTHFGVRVTFPDKQQAIFSVPSSATTSADWTLMTKTGPISTITPLNGTVAASFGLPGFGSASVAQVVNLAKGGSVTSTNSVAITSGNSTSGFKQLARTGNEAPNATGSPMTGVLFKKLSDPVSGAGGAMAFAGTLSGAAKGSGFWFAADGATAKLLARTGTGADALAPGGGHWKTLGTMVLPADASRGPIFLATLTVSAAEGVTKDNSLGLWAVDSTGTLKLIFRTGQNALINGMSKQVKTFTALAPATGSIGAASGYDDDGNVALLVTLIDDSQALLVITVP